MEKHNFYRSLDNGVVFIATAEQVQRHAEEYGHQAEIITEREYLTGRLEQRKKEYCEGRNNDEIRAHLVTLWEDFVEYGDDINGDMLEEVHTYYNGDMVQMAKDYRRTIAHLKIMIEDITAVIEDLDYMADLAEDITDYTRDLETCED